MNYKPIFCIFLLFGMSFAATGQTVSDSTAPQSRLLRFSAGEGGDPARAVLNLFIHDDLDETVLGATALLQRAEPASVHGKITQWDGKCQFRVSPGTYSLRIQLTGMVTYEQGTVELLAGQQYDMEIEMVRVRPPVPSAKQQAGKN